MSLVGLRMTGFKYETREGFDFDTFMEGLVGKSGEIIHDLDNALVVSFAGNIIAKYPKPEASKYVFKISNDYIDTMDWDKVKEDAEKEKMKKEVFKEGDRVFHIEYGWGVVIQADKSVRYGIEVKFDEVSFDCGVSYTLDGKEFESSKQSLLSFTEYTLWGFSQERPFVLPNVGELCLVRDFKDNVWKAREFKKFTTHFLDVSGERWDEFKRIKILD